MRRTPTSVTARFLALGDSYTIGEGVAASERWPVVLAERLRDQGILVDDPVIIAKTGWTTEELDAAIDAAAPRGKFALVTLLIGVNDQYRGKRVQGYREHFTKLLDGAIGFAGGDVSRVIVISIPDWGVTPFAEGRHRDEIATQINVYNAANREIAMAKGAEWIDVTPSSRKAGAELAADGLHPGASMYREWVKLIEPVALRILSR